MPSSTEKLLSEWMERDRAAAWLPDDRRALEDTASLRLLCLELFRSAADSPDLYNACIRFGGTLAERGASPTLAACALDGARTILEKDGQSVADGTWRAARAALLEGYVRVTRENAERASYAAWEPPRCFIVVEPGLAAVAASHPAGDADVLTPWAGRIAGALLLRGIKRAVIGGDGLAQKIVLQSVTEAGIAATAAATSEVGTPKSTR
jgi:hypothetical protein